MPALTDPPPHFLSLGGEDDERRVARVLVSDDETAAVLDGLVLTYDDAPELHRLVIHSLARQIVSELDDGGEYTESIDCADSLHALAARLPLASRLLQFHTLEKEGDMGIAGREGWATELREILVGKLPSFTVTGKERDALVYEARRWRKHLRTSDRPGAVLLVRELKLLLRDTGKKRDTGEPAVLSSLAMPELVEWCRRFGVESWPDHYAKPKKERKAEKRRHEVIRKMWVRLNREVKAGPQKGGCW